MKAKMTILASALFTTFAGSALADDPPLPPAPYNPGPASLQVSAVNLSKAEKAAYALYEGVMQLAESVIHATNCNTAAGYINGLPYQYDVDIFTDGTGTPSSNTVTVYSRGGSVTLQNTAFTTLTGYGDHLTIAELNPTGDMLAGVPVKGYSGTFSYNTKATIMDGSATMNALGLNGRYDLYTGSVIKDFYKGCVQGTQCTDPRGLYDVFDWGLQDLSKLGYPTNKYWQRSKSRRYDGELGHTVFVKDRLVGTSSCRIVIDTIGTNNLDIFQESGTLTITPTTPGTAYAWF